MEKQINNKDNVMKLAILNEAVGEQMKSQAADDGLEKGKRGTKAIPAQIVGVRRRTENIFAGMIKNSSFAKSFVKEQQAELTSKTPNTRKRKRGPRSIRYYESKC